MLSVLNKWFGKSSYSADLAHILAEVNNREELLGMKAPIIPTPDGIKVDAAKILKYTDSNGYKKYAEEAWARIIEGLDKILDERSNDAQRQYHCGAVRATLDLLRLSYQARLVIETWDKEHPASSRQVHRG